MLRVVRELRPRWVVGENVLGLVNWNRGLVFEEVQADLESQGYEVQPYVLPACAVNAPHRRDRVWFVSKNTMRSGWAHRESEQERTTVRQFGDISTRSANGVCLSEGATPDAHEPGYTEQHGAGEPGRTGHASGHGGSDWHDFPTQSPVCSRNDGFSGRLDGITFPKWRNESIKAAGNAIVPQVAYQIFKAIEAYEQR
jgi:DNA (cytosine-5)-methyltransferase 1